MLHMDVSENLCSVDVVVSNSEKTAEEGCWLDSLDQKDTKRDAHSKKNVQEISIHNTDDKIKEVDILTDDNKTEIPDTNIKKSRRNYSKKKIHSVHLQDNGQSSLSTSELSKNSVADKVVLKDEKLVPVSMVIPSPGKQSSSDCSNTSVANGKSITHMQSKILTPVNDDNSKSESSGDGPLSKYRGTRNCTKFLTEESTFTKAKHTETSIEVANRSECKTGNEQKEGNSSEKSEILMHKNTKGLIAAVKSMGRMQPYVSLNINDTKRAFEKYFQNKHRLLADDSTDTVKVDNSLAESLNMHNSNGDVVKSVKGQKNIKIPNQNKADLHCSASKDAGKSSKNLTLKSKSLFNTGNIVTRSKSSVKQDNITIFSGSKTEYDLQNSVINKTEKSTVNSLSHSPSNKVYVKEPSNNCANESRNVSLNCKTNAVEGHNVADGSVVFNMKELDKRNNTKTSRKNDNKSVTSINNRNESEISKVKTQNSKKTHQSHLPQDSFAAKTRKNRKLLEKKNAEMTDLQKCKDSTYLAQNSEPVFQAPTRKQLSFSDLFRKFSENSAQLKAQAQAKANALAKVDAKSSQSINRVTSLNNIKFQREIDLPKKLAKETGSEKNFNKSLPSVSLKSPDVKSRMMQGKNLLNSSAELSSRFIKNEKLNDLPLDSKKSSKRKGVASVTFSSNEFSSRLVENEKYSDLNVNSSKSAKKAASLSLVKSCTLQSSISLEDEKYSDTYIDSKMASKMTSVSVVNSNNKLISRSIKNEKHRDFPVCPIALKRKALVSVVDSSDEFSSNKKSKNTQQSVLQRSFSPLPKEIAVKTLRKNTNISVSKKLHREKILSSSVEADVDIIDEKIREKNHSEFSSVLSVRNNDSLESSKKSSGPLAVSVLKRDINIFETSMKLTDKIMGQNNQQFPKKQSLNSVSVESDQKTLETVTVLKKESSNLASNKLLKRKNSNLIENSLPVAHRKIEAVLNVEYNDYGTNKLLEKGHGSLYLDSMEISSTKSNLHLTSGSSHPKELPEKHKQVLDAMCNDHVENKLFSDRGALFKNTSEISPAKSNNDITLGSTGSKETPKQILNMRKQKKKIIERNKFHRYLLPKPSEMNTSSLSSDAINADTLPFMTPNRFKTDVVANIKPSKCSPSKPVQKNVENKISKSTRVSSEISPGKPGSSSKSNLKSEGNTTISSTDSKMGLNSSNVPNNLHQAGKPGYYINKSMIPAIQYPNNINNGPQSYNTLPAFDPTKGPLALVVPSGGSNILVPLALNGSLPLSAPMQMNRNIFVPVSTNQSSNLLPAPSVCASNNFGTMLNSNLSNVNIKAVPSKHINSSAIGKQASVSALQTKFQQEPTQEQMQINYEETTREKTLRTTHSELLGPLNQYSFYSLFFDMIAVHTNTLNHVAETCISSFKSTDNWFSQRSHLRHMSVRQFCTTPEVMNTFGEHVLRPSDTQNAESPSTTRLTEFQFPEPFYDVPVFVLIKDFIRYHITNIKTDSRGMLTYKSLNDYPVRTSKLLESVYMYRCFKRLNSNDKMHLKDLVSHLFLVAMLVIYDEFNKRELKKRL